jgi:hypothetical protein
MEVGWKACPIVVGDTTVPGRVLGARPVAGRHEVAVHVLEQL